MCDVHEKLVKVSTINFADIKPTSLSTIEKIH